MINLWLGDGIPFLFQEKINSGSLIYIVECQNDLTWKKIVCFHPFGWKQTPQLSKLNGRSMVYEASVPSSPVKLIKLKLDVSDLS